MRGVLDGLCAEGILVPSKSPWSSLIVPVPKKDGSVSVCGNFRKINKVTVLDHYCIPLVIDIVGRVADCQYLSKLDLNKCFHQVPLVEDVQMKTAIVTVHDPRDGFGDYHSSSPERSQQRLQQP